VALHREAIVDAAFELLADGGLDAITARALAARLGVRAGALYYHLPDMAALRDEMATRVVRRVLQRVGEAAGSDWATLLRTAAARTRDTLLGYRDGAMLVAGTRLLDDEALRSLEVPLAALVAAGFAPLDAQRALATVNAYVVGFVIEEQERRDPVRGAAYTAEHRRARLDPDAQPLSHALSDEVVALPEEAFTWGVEAIVAGIGARRGG
jgi:TetR/AcrR family transcriptional regulator, tetracycline repressor protein